MPPKFSPGQNVEYHMGSDTSTTYTGQIKSIAQERPVRYKVRPVGAPASGNQDVLVNEENISRVVA